MFKNPHVAGVGFAVVFGLTFMFSKTALDVITPIGLIAYRFLMAFVVFEILRRFKLITIRFTRAHLSQIGIVVLFQPVLYFLFETYGLDRTTSAEAGMMIALIPIFVSILGAVILKEKPRLIQLFFILFSVSGIIFIQLMRSVGGFDMRIVGFLLLLGAVLSAAFYNIASRNASRLLKPVELTYFMMLTGAVVFNLLYLGVLFYEGRLGDYTVNLLNPALTGAIFYLGVVASFGGFFLLNYALSKLQAHVISIYANLATVVAIAAGAIFLSEALHYYHYIGAGMILTGVYGTVRTNKRRIKELKPASSRH